MNKSELLAKLSSQISEPLIYSAENDCENGEIHFLFNIGRALIWVVQENGIVTSVLDSDEMGYDNWLYKNHGESEKLVNNSVVKLEIHKGDVRILNSKANIELFNELVKYL